MYIYHLLLFAWVRTLRREESPLSSLRYYSLILLHPNIDLSIKIIIAGHIMQLSCITENRYAGRSNPNTAKS